MSNERTGAVKALEPFAAAYRKHYDPGVSDLDDEQPVSWHVPLGAYRLAVMFASPALQEPGQEAEPVLWAQVGALGNNRREKSKRFSVPLYTHPAPQAPVAAVEGQVVAIKPLEWRHYPDAFPPMWVANAALGHYSIEEAAGSDSPSYDVLNPTMGRIANIDGLSEAKQVAQTDHDKRVRACLTHPVQPAGTDAIREARANVEYMCGRWEENQGASSLTIAVRTLLAALNPTSEKTDGPA